MTLTTLKALSDVGCHKHSPCRHNVLVVSDGIVGSNKQTPLTGPNKPPHWAWGSALVPFVTIRTQPCKYCSFWARGSALKHVYLVKRSLYICITRNFFPYSMWDVTIIILPLDDLRFMSRPMVNLTNKIQQVGSL